MKHISEQVLIISSRLARRTSMLEDSYNYTTNVVDANGKLILLFLLLKKIKLSIFLKIA